MAKYESRSLESLVARVWRRFRFAGSNMDDMIRRLRVEREAESEQILAFWRDHGRDWARQEASYNDLKLIGELADHIAGLSSPEKLVEVESALRAVWRTGFATPSEAFGWNDMNDALPAAALVAFVEGAGKGWTEARSKL
jgi:hypothetical protein